MMIMASRNDIKGRLIHNQSPFPTKDKVLSYTIPIEHTEPLLFCSSSSSDSSGGCSSTGAKNGASNISQDNDSLNFIGPDDDPCTGRDSLASFLDEGLGTSLDGVDEVTSPIFSSLGRNDSGAFSSDEGTGGGVVGKVGVDEASTGNETSGSSNSNTHNSAGSSLSSRSTSVAEVVCWKGSSTSSSVTSGRNDDADVISHSPSSAVATIPLVAVSAGINGELNSTPPKYIISCEHLTKSSDLTVEQSTLKLYSHEDSDNEGINDGGSSGTCRKGHSQHHHRSKNMPLGRQGPQKCSICEKAFSNASALTKHKLTHSDERRHACATCGKAFKRQDHLNGHMLTHRNKKPFECKSKGCGKSYCDARSLRRHVENRHGHEVLESMNLTSHRLSKKYNGCNPNNHAMKSQQSNGKYQQHPQEPQQELVQFTPIKIDYPETTDGSDDRDSDSGQDGDPLEAKPQIQVEVKKDKSKPPEIVAPMNIQPISVPEAGPPVLEKMVEASPSCPSSCFTLPREGVPIVVKRENMSVFDFDESLEDNTAPPYNGTPGAPIFSAPAPISASAPQIVAPEKLPPQVVKINNIMDPSKLGPDLKLIQEWARRLGDSKVALFLSSSPSPNGTSSITQFSGPLQLAGGGSGTSHAFIPTSENGIFSVTPISIIPTSSNEFSLKRADIIMTNDSSESGKPFYILPTQQFMPSNNVPPPPTPNPIHINEPSKVQPPPKPMQTTNEPKNKSEAAKGKTKTTGIGTALANRIKTKLKAGSLKKYGKGNGESKSENGHHVPKQSKHQHQCPVSIVNDTPVLSEMGSGEGDTHGDLMLIPIQSSPHSEVAGGPQVGPIPPTTTTNGDNGGSGVGAISWCESPKDCLMHAMEEDRLSDGDGDEKPVECSICCRRFKNTPALNGHMRLHGGYFKKETEGSKKKEVSSKDNNHGTPLQTVSVSVRALIEEKIKERRNNLLKLAAAAAAEKAANEQGGSAPMETTSSSSNNQATLPSYNNHDKPKSDKSSSGKPGLIEHKAAPAISTNIAQKVQESISHNNKPSKHGTPKLNPELTSEKDRNCDHLINDNCRSKLINTNSKPIIITNNNNISSSSSTATTASVNLDLSFQDPSMLMGSSNTINIGNGLTGLPPSQPTSVTIANGGSGDLAMTPQLLLRDPMQSQPMNNGELTFPFQMLDKSNFTLLDCGINPADQSCHAFHIIYVDNNGESIPLTVGQGGVGKVADLFPGSTTKMPTLPQSESMNEASDLSGIKGIKDALMGCPPPSQSAFGDDPCTPLWEWKSSTSSDNTDTSFGIPQDCVNSFFGSSSSDTLGDSCTKDPVAAGRGYCYTPMYDEDFHLSPNSSFCLTPGPDSPFDISAQNQSLSFLCPSPTMGDGPIFSYSSVPSLVNPPSSEEPIFSPDPPQLTPATPINISPAATEAQKCFQFQPISNQPPKLENSVFIPEFETGQCQTKDGIISMSHNAPIQSPFMSEPPPPPSSMKTETVLMDCLPPITTFPTMVNNTTLTVNNNNEKFENFPNYNLVYQCPIDNILGSNLMQQQQTFIPFEVFTSTPIPSRVVDKWISGKTGKPRKIHVGPEFQAELPRLIDTSKGKSKRGRSMDEKLWDPHVLHSITVEEVENYLEFACCSAVPGGGTNKEYALHLLMLSKGNIKEALLRLMEKIPALPPKLKNYSYSENQRWSSEEIISFQISLFQVGKDFSRIAKSIGTKCKEECASFYYFWKKVCSSQYNVMKQIWKGRLEHQQIQLSQQNANILDLISSNNNHGSFHNGCSGV